MEITKLRYELIKERKKYQRQVFSLLSVIFPEYGKTAIKNPFSITSTAILQKFPIAQDLAHAKPKQIEKIVRSIKGNNFNIEEIGQLIKTAQTSIYSGLARETRAISLRILLWVIFKTLFFYRRTGGKYPTTSLTPRTQRLLPRRKSLYHPRTQRQNHRSCPLLPGN
jgi:hypothetical protein